MTTYYETKIQYQTTLENGKQKKVTESLLVDALSFTEAEARTIKYGIENIPGDFSVVAEKPTKYAEIINKNGAGECYYRVKVLYINIDEKSGETKKTASLVLVKADELPENAIRILRDYFRSSMTDYEIADCNITKIKDVIQHENEGL